MSNSSARLHHRGLFFWGLSVLLTSLVSRAQDPPTPDAFIRKYCLECHDAQSKSGGLDLANFAMNLDSTEAFRLWIRLHDRVRSGEIPLGKFATSTGTMQGLEFAL
jgi:hypothetical protein